jgi:hypothetical protein
MAIITIIRKEIYPLKPTQLESGTQNPICFVITQHFQNVKDNCYNY